MKKIIKTLIVLLVISQFNIAQQSSEIGKNKKQHGGRFIDLDGDGYNDNAPDHDGDGIPNGIDHDYRKNKTRKFVDLDGDGINDNTSFGKGYRKSLRATIKNRKDLEESGKEHFNNHFKGLGFGFENKFGRNQSGKNGTGTFDGPWHWGWKYGNGQSSGSGNGNGTGSGDGGIGDSNGPWNWGWGRGHGGG